MAGANQQFGDGEYLFDSHLNSLEEGILGNGVVSGFAVVEKGTGANKTVDVGSGTAVVNGTVVTVGSTSNVDLTSYIDGDNPKKVLIMLEDDDSIDVVDGTAKAAAPVGNTGPETYEPLLPDKAANKIILAEVWLAAGETTIQDSDITDRRITVLEQGLLANMDWTEYNVLQGNSDDEAEEVSLAGPIDECVVPAGGILIWHGTIASIPSGFVICDGNNSTPNLLTRFLQGVASAATNPGTTGGAATVTLTASTIPAHAHRVYMYGSGGTQRHFLWETSKEAGSTYYQTSQSIGSGGAHQNEPTFYDVAFLMKS